MLGKRARALVRVSSVLAAALAAACDVMPTQPPSGGMRPTPFPVVTITIGVRAWDFSPGGPVSAPLTLAVGTTYTLIFHNVDEALVENPWHGFTGVPELGLSGTDAIERGGPDFIIENVTLGPSQRGIYPFSCTNTVCGGDPQQHAGMSGFIIVQ